MHKQYRGNAVGIYETEKHKQRQQVRKETPQGNIPIGALRNLIRDYEIYEARQKWSGSAAEFYQEMSKKYGISAPRSASLLDTASCVIQGILPYGAQLLMGSALAGLTAFAIIPYLFYPFVMGLSALVFIIFGLAEKK